ncbi:hypothetical protein GCM10023085_63900 [Actinomadura viridis]|uniref:Uncharacterized protein n=1 Tax=Actinomadura viridis TaxID=58110 RepID=A0A931DNH3_9ACTN|nr:hypothetical protein [Actinomadura viridis]MBG6093190.1 hypothetical protein [Actinomadura viridis]
MSTEHVTASRPSERERRGDDRLGPATDGRRPDHRARTHLARPYENRRHQWRRRPPPSPMSAIDGPAAGGPETGPPWRAGAADRRRTCARKREDG